MQGTTNPPRFGRVSPVTGDGQAWAKRYTGAGWYDSNPFLARYEITPDSGRFHIHTGADLQLPANTDKGKPVYAVQAGVVTFARDARRHIGRPTTWGNVIVISHTEQRAPDATAELYYSRYAHLARMDVREGERVAAGQQIGVIGKTGMETYWNGEHLHFDISPTNILATQPLYWPGDNAVAVRTHFAAPYEFLFGTPPISERLSDFIVTAFPSLRVRATPSLSAAVLGTLMPGTRIRAYLQADVRPGTRGAWARLAERQGYVSAEYLAYSPATGPLLQVGANVDFRNPVGSPPPADVAPLRLVRLPYATYYGDVDGAHGLYGPRIDAYLSAGITPIIVLNHQTWGEGQGFNWNQMTAADWARLIPEFAARARAVAVRYQNGAIYQVWNEGDQPSEAAVGIPPDVYARLLDATVTAVRGAVAGARLLSQGHVSGDPRYWTAVRAESQTASTLLGVAIHPYGIGGGPYGRFGTVGELVGRWRGVTSLPLWFTEFGVCGGSAPTLPDTSVTAYLSSFLDQCKTHRVAAAVWYGYGTGMHNCKGLTDGGRKGALWEVVKRYA